MKESERLFQIYWDIHWDAMLARAMGDNSMDECERKAYQTYINAVEREEEDD